MQQNKLEISGNWIRVIKKPGDLFLNIFKGRRVAKIKDMEIAKDMVKLYNDKIDEQRS